MNPEEQDALWELLQKAKEPVVSPYFSRNVLREVRALGQERPGILPGILYWLRGHWRRSVISACVATMAAGAFVSERSQEEKRVENQQLVAMAERVSTSPDYQVINHLDELLDSDKNSVWLDSNAD